MGRFLYVLFGVIAYLIFFATFLYLIGFLADLPGLPRTVDSGPLAAPARAAIVDLLLVAIFGLQHSIMARRRFKRVWTRLVPEAIERSTYVLFASAVLILLYVLWRPIPAPVWSVSGPLAWLLWSICALGWLIVLSSTFLLNHFELFGLSQVWRNLRGTVAATPRLREPLFYKFDRHPLYTGFVIAFWATPVMSLGHLLFAAAMTVYIVIAIRFEEHDLIGLFGTQYEMYRRRVGMLVPRLR